MAVGRVLSLAIAVLAFAGAADAQGQIRFPRTSLGATPLSPEQIKMAQNDSISAHRYQTGVDALKARNFKLAESIFRDWLVQNPTHPQGNFMMGVAQMSLGNWGPARKFLEVAVIKSPKEPDPKSRLGVTLIKLGDIDGALKQRRDLEEMNKACQGMCRNSNWIMGGLAMIDAALPARRS